MVESRPLEQFVSRSKFDLFEAIVGDGAFRPIRLERSRSPLAGDDNRRCTIVHHVQLVHVERRSRQVDGVVNLIGRIEYHCGAVSDMRTPRVVVNDER